MMKGLFPSDPIADREALMSMAGKTQESVAPTKDYVQESVEVPQGSMPLGIDSLSDFAKLAGVTEKQHTGSAGQAKGSDPMPSTSKPSTTGEQPHPLKDKLVGEDHFDSSSTVGEARDKIQRCGAELGLHDGILEVWTRMVQDLLMKLLVRQERPSGGWPTLDAPIGERELTGGEKRSREANVKKLKKHKSDFEKRYGDDAESVMYAVATKRAKQESIKEQLLKALNDYK